MKNKTLYHLKIFIIACFLPYFLYVKAAEKKPSIKRPRPLTAVSNGHFSLDATRGLYVCDICHEIQLTKSRAASHSMTHTTKGSYHCNHINDDGSR